MMIIRTGDIANNPSLITQTVANGEPVFVTRPKNKNWVIVSEASYKEFQKASQNAAYLKMLAKSEEDIKAGRVVYKTLEELEEMERSM